MRVKAKTEINKLGEEKMRYDGELNFAVNMFKS